MTPGVFIEGYAARTDQVDLDGDLICPGSAHLSPPSDIAMLWQHRRWHPIGRWVHLSEDSRGLLVRGWVHDAKVCGAIAKGADGLSIGFRTHRQTAMPGGGRRLLAIDLVEISLTQNPMQPAARFSANWPAKRAA